MTEIGTIHQGAIVPDKPLGLAEGARVEFEVTGEKKNYGNESNRRQGGWLKGQIRIAEDFDELPDDVAEAFGMKDS